MSLISSNFVENVLLSKKKLLRKQTNVATTHAKETCTKLNEIRETENNINEVMKDENRTT